MGEEAEGLAQTKCKSYQFTPDYEYWINGLKSALEGQGATLVELGNERWSVQH